MIPQGTHRRIRRVGLAIFGVALLGLLAWLIWGGDDDEDGGRLFSAVIMRPREIPASVVASISHNRSSATSRIVILKLSL